MMNTPISLTTTAGSTLFDVADAIARGDGDAALRVADIVVHSELAPDDPAEFPAVSERTCCTVVRLVVCAMLIQRATDLRRSRGRITPAEDEAR